MTNERQELSEAEAAYAAACEAYSDAVDAKIAAKTAMRAAERRLREARPSSGKAVGDVVFGSGGFVADEVHGGMHLSYGSIGSSVSVIGRIINGGVVKTCTNCGGDSGWQKVNDGPLVHTACGAEQ